MDAKREFVRRLWDRVVPTYEVSGFLLDPWVPEEFLDPLGKFVDRDKIRTIPLNDPRVVDVSFETIRENISRNWVQLMPEVAIYIVETITDLNLWTHFDRERMPISKEQTELASIRFDISDIIFSSKEEDFNSELKKFNLDLEKKIIMENVDASVKNIILAFSRRAIQRQHIDIAIVIVQAIPRNSLIVDRISSRLNEIYQDMFLPLRDIVMNSIWWTTPDGKTYISVDEIPEGYRVYIPQIVAKKIVGFEDEVRRAQKQTAHVIPERSLIDECAKLMRRYTMNPQPVTTNNITLTNSQLGILNTGTIENVKSIDVTIGDLHSQGSVDVGNALKGLSQSVLDDDKLDEKEKSELLEKLKFLGDQATEKSTRNTSVVKSVLRSIADAVAAAGKAATAWTTWGPVLLKFFGL